MLGIKTSYLLLWHMHSKAWELPGWRQAVTTRPKTASAVFGFSSWVTSWRWPGCSSPLCLAVTCCVTAWAPLPATAFSFAWPHAASEAVCVVSFTWHSSVEGFAEVQGCDGAGMTNKSKASTALGTKLFIIAVVAGFRGHCLVASCAGLWVEERSKHFVPVFDPLIRLEHIRSPSRATQNLASCF